MIKKFGKTWWGEQWLNALNAVDEDNRLTRGRTYANNGSIKKIVIKGNLIQAQVQGHSTKPYKVMIILEKFNSDQKKIIKQVIESKQSYLISLTNHILPTDINKMLLNQNIHLFPIDYGHGISAQCNCPDSAVPCKHIAAVLYKLSETIDCDPFKIFELHDCDLKEIIQDFQNSEEKKKKQTYSMYTEGVKHFVAEPNIEQLDEINFSKIKDLGEMTFNLLRDKPVFAEDNFLTKMKKFYDYCSKEGKGLQFLFDYDLGGFFGGTPSSMAKSGVVIALKENLCIKSFSVDDEGNLKNYRANQLINFLMSCNSKFKNVLSDEWLFLYYVFQFVIALMEKRAFVPQIVENDKGFSIILLQPALYDDYINDIFEKLAENSPVILEGFKSSIGQLKVLISVLIRLIINPSELVSKGILNKTDRISKLFFGAEAIKFGKTDEFLPVAIDHWLQQLNEIRTFYLVVKDKDDRFSIDLKVLENGAKSPILFKTAIKRSSEAERIKLLSDASWLVRYLPEMSDILQSKGPIFFDIDDFSKIFRSILPALKTLGVRVMLPRGLRNLFVPKISLKIKASQGFDPALKIDLSQLLQFDWQIAVGKQSVDLQTFKKLLSKSKGLIKIKDNYVFLDDAQIEKMLNDYDALQNRTLTPFETLQAGLAQKFESYDVAIDKSFKKIMNQIQNYKPCEIPKNLNANLRPYQKNGYSWLLQNIDMGFGSILADDMGLGKTLQTIAVLLHLKNTNRIAEKKVIIVVPSSLIMNWHNEIERFAPTLKVKVYHSNGREMEGDFDILLTSYALVQRDIEKINKKSWFLVIIDEAQNIKNPLTKQSKAVKSLNADHKIALSGTPVENRLLDYWSIFDFTNRGYLGTKTHFSATFAAPIERDRDENVLDTFKKITNPFIMRRAKTDKNVIADLPDKVENNCFYELSKEQAALYQQIVDNQMDNIAKNEGIDRKGLIFKLINDLKQVCNHPAQYLKRNDPTIDESGKMQLLMELLENIYNDTNDKVLIFTQYTQMGDILVRLLEEKFKQKVLFFHGGLSIKKKQEIIDDFQNSTKTRVLILSLKAGGTGLNLTQASHVIHYDLWWNPSVENQASDRAYRIGQHQNVMIYRLMSENTLEKRIDDIIQRKKYLSDVTVSKNENWLTELNDKQLRDLVSLRNEHVSG